MHAVACSHDLEARTRFLVAHGVAVRTM